MSSRAGRICALAALLAGACAPAPAAAPPAATASVAATIDAATAQPSVASSAPAASEPAPLQWGAARVQFASATEGKTVLGEPDAFVKALSAFDRSLRVGTADAVDEKRYLEHAAAQALPWPEDARGRWRDAALELQRALVGLDLPLPDRVLLVVTTGREELGAPHTRANAIVLPEKAVQKMKLPLRLLAHELLHVSTRHQPELRDKLYAVLGFQRVEPVAYPAELEARRLTNPDAHEVRHAIKVEANKKTFLVAPLLVSKVGPAEAAGVSVQSFFELRLIELSAAGIPMQKSKAGGARLHAVDSTDYLKRAAINTEYAIHPEEVLAENFEKLIQRRAGLKIDVPRPEILDALEKALASGKQGSK